MSEKLKIMIIDDEEIVGKRLKPALEKRGDIIESFVNSKMALKRLSEEHFDIVITDIRMDEIDGLEVLDYVKSHSKDTKVIMITGYATVEVAREALTKGAFDFIAKPFKPDDLRTIINKAVKQINTESSAKTV
jgi:DNA-binding NtrC family response regulator